MAFSTIYIPPNLSPEDHARAVKAAPEFVESEMDYPTLIATTGWTLIERHDLTGAFIRSCQQRVSIEEELRAELLLINATAFEARQMRLRSRLPVLQQGHLRRELFIVQRVG